jgi:acyl phosphate:glycerol-3-phosphate acyltransferase
MIARIILLFFSYLLGSFPTGYIIGKKIKGIDIREHGSKNVGATNVFRTIGKKYGVIVLMLDMLKGLLPVIIAKNHFSESSEMYIITVGIIAIAGHIWTVFLSFKGGKGVATTAGVFLGLATYPVLIALLVFGIIVYLTHYISAGSILAAIVLPFLILIFNSYEFSYLFWITVVVVIFIVYKHKDNIVRIINKTENKIY